MYRQNNSTMPQQVKQREKNFMLLNENYCSVVIDEPFGFGVLSTQTQRRKVLDCFDCFMMYSKIQIANGKRH